LEIRFIVVEGKTHEIAAEQARRLLESIDTGDVVGLIARGVSDRSGVAALTALIILHGNCHLAKAVEAIRVYLHESSRSPPCPR
jgi:hypothetical protein